MARVWQARAARLHRGVRARERGGRRGQGAVTPRNSGGGHAVRVTAIILAGTFVWREDAFDGLWPRVLLPVANAPLVSYTLDWLRRAAVTSATICVNDLAGLVVRHLGDGSEQGFDLQYYVDCIPRGPAGCARDAGSLRLADAYVVVEGAVIPRMDLQALLSAHAESRADATVTVTDCDSAREYHARGGNPAGVYVLTREALDQVGATSYQDIKETLLVRLIRRGQPVMAYPTAEVSPRVSELRSYVDVQGWVLDELQSTLAAPREYKWRRGACLHRSARVAESARWFGPVMIGPAAVVEEHAVLVGPTVLGRACHVGRASVVEQSVMWDGSAVGSRAKVDGCVLPAGVAIDPGAVAMASICHATPAGH